MQLANQSATVHESSHFNGRSAAQDLFVLSDEQILEIEPQQAGTSAEQQVTSRDSSTMVTVATPETSVGDETSAAATTESSPSSSTSQQPQVTSHESEPPAWLAAQMKDPWTGADARELWEGTQRAEREAAAYREVFAKPEEAKTAAERARTLDDIDRAYFAGDATQRAQLAAMMMREDPAAFREMVFEGLRALESAGTPGSNRSVADAIARMHGNSSAADSRKDLSQTQNAAPVTLAEKFAATSQSGAPAQNREDTAQQAQLAAYAAFEKSANDDLERSVGSAIERTLTNALPSLNSARGTSGSLAQQAAPLQERLTAAIRQDVEKALQSDRQLGKQVAQILAWRRFDNETRAQVVRLINERALQLVPVAAKRALKDWTETTLATYRTRAGGADFAGHAEVTPAASQNASRAASAANSPQTSREAKNREIATRGATKSSRVDYRRLSDEQILEL